MAGPRKTISETKRVIERKSERFVTYLTPSMEKLVLDKAADLQIDPTQYARDAFEFYLANKDNTFKSESPRSYRGKFLTKAPCGDWEEAIEHAGFFVISEDTANELDAHDGDLFVRAVGESMEEAGIMDSALLLMRPLNTRAPRRGDIVLVEIATDDGEYQSTIKHWNPGNPPRLTDGKGDDFPLPDNTINVRAVAELQGLISRF